MTYELDERRVIAMVISRTFAAVPQLCATSRCRAASSAIGESFVPIQSIVEPSLGRPSIRSGTEPVIRIMGEGEDATLVSGIVDVVTLNSAISITSASSRSLK